LYLILTGKDFNIQGTTLGGNNTDYGFTFTNTGLAIPTTKETKVGWADFKENTLPLILTAVSVAFPGAAPYIQSYNAAKAAANGQWAAAAFSGLAAASGFSAQVTADINALANAGDLAGAEQLYNDSWLAQNTSTLKTAKDAASFVNAIDQKNVAGVINAGMNLAGTTLPPEVRTAVNWANLGSAIANNDYAGMANAASTLTGSSNLKVAASAANFVKALEIFNKTGNPAGLISAGNAFGNTIKGLPTSTGTDVVTTLQDAGLTEGQNLSVAEQRANALTTIYDYNSDSENLGINLISPTQLASGDGYTGGLPKPEFKPNQVNIDTATGKAFFTTIDTSGTNIITSATKTYNVFDIEPDSIIQINKYSICLLVILSIINNNILI
jgi:hypothetical protein